MVGAAVYMPLQTVLIPAGALHLHLVRQLRFTSPRVHCHVRDTSAAERMQLNTPTASAARAPGSTLSAAHGGSWAAAVALASGKPVFLLLFQW